MLSVGWLAGWPGLVCLARVCWPGLLTWPAWLAWLAWLGWPGVAAWTGWSELAGFAGLAGLGGRPRWPCCLCWPGACLEENTSCMCLVCNMSISTESLTV